MSAKELVERARRQAAEIRKYELVAEPLPTIRTPNADVFAARLRKGETVAVLSQIDRRSRVGKNQYLLNDAESVKISDEAAKVVAIVTTKKAARFDTVDDIPSDLRDGVDPVMLGEHENASPVYVIPVQMVAAFTEPVELQHDVPGRSFGPPLDISRVALAKREVTVTTGETNGHKHEAVFDPETGDGRTGAPTDNKKGHTHLIKNFKVQAGDEGHTHSLPKKQAKSGEPATEPVADPPGTSVLDASPEEIDAAVSRLRVAKLYHHILTQRNVQIIAKREELEERFVLGVVLEPEEVDSQKHIYSEADVRKAAHNFLEVHARMGLMHTEDVTGKIKILESFVAPVNMEIDGVAVKKGTWLLGARIVDDELWEGVKNGKFNGWSIGGTAIESIEDADQLLAALTG
jgi:hypothetical protein